MTRDQLMYISKLEAMLLESQLLFVDTLKAEAQKKRITMAISRRPSLGDEK